MVEQGYMRVVAPSPLATQTRRVLLERVETLDYIPYEYELQETASRLKRQGYRGAICGPAGCGKSAMLHALGDELMAHGLTPLPLSVERDRARALPTDWRRTIRKARHTDALLLDGYGLLPAWARLWVWFASRRAGAVVVTSKRAVRYKTLAKPRPTKQLLQQLAQQLLPISSQDIDYSALFEQSSGNLHEAMRLVSEASATQYSSAKPRQKQAG